MSVLARPYVRNSVVLAATVLGTIRLGLGQTPAQAANQPPVTFTKDIAPLLQRACQNCHRPGSIAPMSLLTYQDARPWARSIKEAVVKHEMPPWYVDRTVGVQKFAHDPSLSDKDITTISKWVDSGAPQGNPADLPAPRKFDDMDRWHIGTPDIVVRLQKDRLVKANQPDEWLDLPMEDLVVTEDRYIQAVEIKPLKGVKVLHHADAKMLTDEDGETERGTFLEEYAVGKFGDIFPEGTGRLLKAGTKLATNVHLHAVGEDTAMNLAVGLKLYPKGVTPKHIEITQHIGDNEDFDIPPNTANARADGYTVLTRPTRLTSFQPHMHDRGKAQCVEAIYPSSSAQRAGRSRVETISCVDRFHFDWHIVYHYNEDAQPLLPAGTILHVISWFDNTAQNKYDPDPSNWVGFGQRTIDDMSFAWMSFYYLNDDEYKQALAEQTAKAEREKKLSSAEFGLRP
jgi:hypothetical protein